MYSVQCSAVLCNHLWYYRHWIKSLFTCMYFDAITFLTLLRFVSSITFWYFLFISPMNWSTLSSEKGPLSYPKKPTHFKHSGFTITKLLRSCLHCVCITCKHSTDVMNIYLRKRQQQWFWKIFYKDEKENGRLYSTTACNAFVTCHTKLLNRIQNFFRHPNILLQFVGTMTMCGSPGHLFNMLWVHSVLKFTP